MKRKLVSLLIAPVFGICAFAAFAQEPPRGSEPSEDWVKYANPGENHKILDPLVGTWKHRARWWTSPEDKGKETPGGTTTVRWILGGRFLLQVVTGGTKEHPFQGVMVIGYDNAAQEYQSMWLDNMATGMMKATGQYDPSTKTLNEKGSYSDPTHEGIQKQYRSTWTVIDNDHYAYEIFSTNKEGKEFKSLEVYFERTKGEPAKEEKVS
jgi:hypothetical protein